MHEYFKNEWREFEASLTHASTDGLADVFTTAYSVRRRHCSFFLPEAEVPLGWLQTPEYVARRKTEALFEAVRMDLDTEIPSRKVGLFCNVDQHGLNHWRQGLRANGGLYEITGANARVVVGDVAFYNYAVRILDGRWQKSFAYNNASKSGEIRAAARYYWTGARSPTPRLEAIVEGTLTARLIRDGGCSR